MVYTAQGCLLSNQTSWRTHCDRIAPTKVALNLKRWSYYRNRKRFFWDCGITQPNWRRQTSSVPVLWFIWWERNRRTFLGFDRSWEVMQAHFNASFWAFNSILFCNHLLFFYYQKLRFVYVSIFCTSHFWPDIFCDVLFFVLPFVLLKAGFS